MFCINRCSPSAYSQPRANGATNKLVVSKRSNMALMAEQKLPSWLLTELSDAKTNKQLNEYWVTIEGILLGYRTSDPPHLPSNTPLCIDIRDSFEERSSYRLRLGNKWGQDDLLQWFEAKPRQIDGEVVVVSEWTYEFHGYRLFSELSSLPHAR